MLTRVVPPIILAAIALSSAEAQSFDTAWITATVGMESLHRSITTTSGGSYTENHGKPAVGLAFQVPIHSIVRPEVGLRSTVGSGVGFRSARVGLQVRPLRHAGAHLSAGISRTDYWEPGGCVNSGSCGGSDHFGRWHVELSGGIAFPMGRRFTLGPTLWLIEPIQSRQVGKSQFRVIGGGIQLGLR
jgi:hypothetical protein